MRINNSALLACLLLAACQNPGTGLRQEPMLPAADSSSLADSVEDEPAAAPQPSTPAEAPDNELLYVEGKTMLPGNYRIWEESEDPESILKADWLDLHAGAARYQLEALTFQIEEGYDDCAGVKTKAVSSNHKSLLFVQLPLKKQADITSVLSTSSRLWPAERADFVFEGKKYQLEGRGTIQHSEIWTNDEGQQEPFHQVSNYQLRLTCPDGQQLVLLSEESFNDTFMRIAFVGDLDGDHKPDFVISVPRHYEEERVLLLLSTEMLPHRVRVYEAVRQFDC